MKFFLALLLICPSFSWAKITSYEVSPKKQWEVQKKLKGDFFVNYKIMLTLDKKDTEQKIKNYLSKIDPSAQMFPDALKKDRFHVQVHCKKADFEKLLKFLDSLKVKAVKAKTK